MKFGLFGSAQAQRGGPISTAARASAIHRIQRRGRGARLQQHLRGRASFHRLRPGLGDPQPADLVAARTKTLRLGTAVMVLPWHNPVLLAEQAATIDLLSGGRLDFGVGKGYRHNEFASFCIPMGRPTSASRRAST